MPNNLMSLSTFQVDYPEFSTADPALVNRYLTKTGEQFDPGIWGTYLETGHGLLTAHLLAIAPNGMFARLDSDKAETTYNTAYKDLLRAVTSCIRTF